MFSQTGVIQSNVFENLTSLDSKIKSLVTCPTYDPLSRRDKLINHNKVINKSLILFGVDCVFAHREDKEMHFAALVDFLRNNFVWHGTQLHDHIHSNIS